MPHSIIEIIKQRYSVRSYDKREIEPGNLRKLVEYIGAIKSGPLGSAVRFELIEIPDMDAAAIKELGTYGMIRGAQKFIAGAVTKGPRAMEDFGYCMEQIILEATALGMGTCWLGGTLKRSAFAARINLTKDELIPAVTPLGNALDKKPLRDSLISFAVGSKRRKQFSALFFEQTLDTPLIGDPANPVICALECVRLAPSASNKQPWRIIRDRDLKSLHLYIDRDPLYNAASKEIKIQYVDMGIAMCHLELALKELGIAGTWGEVQPAIDAGTFKYVASFNF